MTRARGLWAWAAVLAVSGGGAHAMTYPYIVEADTGGLNESCYSETGTWSRSSSHSTASGLTAEIGSRYTITAGNTATFRLNADFTGDGFGASTMDCEVFVTWFETANLSWPTKFTVTSNDPVATFYLNQNLVGHDVWYSLGTFTFSQNQDYYVTIESVMDTSFVDARADAAMWVPIPEPVSIAFAAIGGLAMLRRRRRA
ncbi:MAG: hypothetical protein JXA69_21255 [Phycisphaerae bacterium]|nr:hypothetical protein [Phycisphaerae bacterium]